MLAARYISGLHCPSRRVCISWATSHRFRQGRATLKVTAIGWDPEGILGTPQAGHITRRLASKQLQESQEQQAEFEAQRQKMRSQLEAARAARTLPASHDEVITFLLETDASEMEYEVARCRPMLNPDFMQHLERQITTERLAAIPSEDRIAELSMLQQYLEEALPALDQATTALVAPAERLRRLLTAPDKAAALYDMAGQNQIDKELITLLDQNIQGAQAASNEDAVKFLTKIRDAARKFVIA